eukprot:6755911-Pyramimonas_sp.AAC.1
MNHLVITFALHAKGHRFEPGLRYFGHFLGWFHIASGLDCTEWDTLTQVVIRLEKGAWGGRSGPPRARRLGSTKK